jgi:hypothetical protein
MRNFLRGLAVAFALVASTVGARAGSPCSLIVQGAVLTAGQWNQCFQGKQDDLGYTPVNKAGDVMTGRIALTASTTFRAGIGVTPGVAPSAPVNGDVWVTATGIFVQINGATVQLSTGGASIAPGTTNQVAIYTGTNSIGGVTTLPSALTIPSPTLSGTVAGSFTMSGNITHSGQTIHTGTSAPASAAGNTVVMGTIASPTLTNTGQAFLYNTIADGANLLGDGSGNDLVLRNKNAAGVCAIATGTSTFNCLNLSLTSPLPIGSGGTGQATQQAAFDALAPTATRAGDHTYWNGTHYVNLAGNNSGTVLLQENSSGVPSWLTTGTGVTTALGVNVGSAGAFVTFNGALGTPSSGVGTNLTALNASNVTTGNLPDAQMPNTAYGSFTMTPITCGSATFGSITARSKTWGKKTAISIAFTITALGTCTNSLTFTLPNTAQSAGGAIGREVNIVNKGFICSIAPSATTAVCAIADGTNFQNGEGFQAMGEYENQ